MIDIGTLKGEEITANKDSDEQSRMLQVEFTNADDLQTVQQVLHTGEDSSGHPDDRVIVIDLAPSYRVVIATDDGVIPTVSSGEKKLYSYDVGKSIKAYVYWRGDGKLELNGNTDFAVRYNELAVAFNQLKSDFDALVSVFNANATKYNTHTHGGVTSGGAVTNVPAPLIDNGSTSTADITKAKIDNVLVPDYSAPPT